MVDAPQGSRVVVAPLRAWLGRRRVLVAGIVLVGLVVVITLAAPLFAPFSPTLPGADRLVPPGGVHWFGTDQLRRDVLSRVIYGGRIPLEVAFSSTVLSLLIGASLGWISGYASGRLDRTLSLVMDALYSFPALILAITIVAMLGPGVLNMVAAIAIVYIPTYFRVARGQTLRVREEAYVEAAQALGARAPRMLRVHIAPNTLNALMAIVSFNIADAILTEAGLAFLGFGLPPPTPDWGFDIQNGQAFLQSGYWWLITFPGIAIVITSLGFNLLGEGIGEAVGPQS
ncbi:MAG TPA: ABC transporter permease [Trueperaceae bacterium]|nr:ABC transporter permease [Trueperaceae bacterium]